VAFFIKGYLNQIVTIFYFRLMKPRHTLET